MSDVSLSETPFQSACRQVAEIATWNEQLSRNFGWAGHADGYSFLRVKAHNLRCILQIVRRTVRTLTVLDRQQLRNLITDAILRQSEHCENTQRPEKRPEDLALLLDTLELDFVRRWNDIARRERARGKARALNTSISTRTRTMLPVESAANAQLEVAIALLRRRNPAATIGLDKIIEWPRPHQQGFFLRLIKNGSDATVSRDYGDSFWVNHYRLPVGPQLPSIIIELVARASVAEYFGVFYSDQEAADAMSEVGLYKEFKKFIETQ